MQGKVEIIMYDSGYVEVLSNFAYPEQVREVLALAQKAMKPGQSIAGVNIGTATTNNGPAFRGNRENHN